MRTSSKGTLFLSRLLLNPRSRQVMSEVEHPYEMHRTLMWAFPGTTDETRRRAREEFGVLFHAEVDDRGGAVKVYVQSCIEPDWSFLDGLDGYLNANAETAPYAHKDIMPACLNIKNEQVLSFRLRANPTKRIARKEDPLRGKRVELYREEDQIAWLMRKGRKREAGGAPGGFELLMKRTMDERGEAKLVPRVNASKEGKAKGRKRGVGQGHETTHLSVLFDGVLRVTDATAFLETLVHGIGPAKAFGFGLLSVAPVPAMT